jgi:hypothetical protein
MFGVIPGEKMPANLLAVLDGAEASRELRPVFEGLDMIDGGGQRSQLRPRVTTPDFFNQVGPFYLATSGSLLHVHSHRYMVLGEHR